MKILFTQELFPPEAAGGGETLAFRITKSLQKMGHSVEVLCSGNPNIKEYKGIKTTRIPINRYLMNFSLPKILELSKDVDLIHTSSGNVCLSSWIAAKLNKKPICCYVHHIFGHNWSLVRGKFLGKLFRFMERFYTTRSYDAVVFQNRSSESLGLESGVDETRTFVIQPGLDYKKFQIKGVRKEPFVLFVGNLRMDKPMVKIKGLEYLLEAARRLPDVKFVVVGEGSYLEELKKTSPRNVEYLGGVFGKDLARLYNKALIFCLPSLTEGFGLTIAEAMACGCAVISTVDIGQEGISIKPRSVDDIVNAVRNMLSNRKKIEMMGKRNRELAKKMTWEKYMNNLVEIYGLLISKHKG